MSITGRYRAWKRGYVIDSQRRDDERVVAICSRQEDAEMVARALNSQGAVSDRDYLLHRVHSIAHPATSPPDECEMCAHELAMLPSAKGEQ